MPLTQNADFVVTGDTPNLLAYSIDGGVTYTPVATGAVIMRGVAFSAKRRVWITIGFSGSPLAFISPNGIKWFTNNAPSASSRMMALAYSDTQDLWIAGNGPSTTGTTPFAISTTGYTWTQTSVNALITTVNGIVFSPSLNLWVAVGGGGNSSVVYSSNGISWTRAVANTITGTSVTWSAIQPMVSIG